MNRVAELNYVPVEDCRSQGNFIQAVCFRPLKAPYTCIAIGILLMIPNNMIVRLLGTFFILMAIFVLRFVKDYKVVDIFDQGVMLYGDEEARTACFIPFTDIKSWNIRHENGHDTIEFKLNDDSFIIRDSFQADMAYRALYATIKEKDEKYLKAQEDRKHHLSIPKALENIKNSLKRNKV